MPFHVYILQSETTGLHYCGYSGNLERRLKQHNDPEYRLSKTTKRIAGSWKLIWSREIATRSEAMNLEKIIKKRGITRFLNELSR